MRDGHVEMDASSSTSLQDELGPEACTEYQDDLSYDKNGMTTEMTSTPPRVHSILIPGMVPTLEGVGIVHRLASPICATRHPNENV